MFHSVGDGVSWLWKGIYVWLWYSLAATLLPAELQLFLEGLVQDVFVHVVGPLALRLLLLWIVHHLAGICAGAAGRPGRRRKAARVVVGTLFALMLVCSGVDFCRSRFPSAPWERAYRAAADVSAWLKKRPRIVFATLWCWAAWWYWLGGALWQDLEFYFSWPAPTPSSGSRSGSASTARRSSGT